MKYKEIEHFGGGGGIYIIRNLVNGHIYVGQTTRRFAERWREHYSAAFCNTGGEKHTPLHKAIIKYGIDNFTFDVLESCDTADLNVREQYWIKLLQADSHDNYNQTKGGRGGGADDPDWVLPVIEDLRNTTLTQREIAEKYGISDGMVSDVNIGARHRQTTVTYPIRQRSHQAIKYAEYAELIINHPELTLKELSAQYNIAYTMLRRVNRGEYKLDYDFPLRSNEKDVEGIIEVLEHTQIPCKEIAKHFHCSESLVQKINNGSRHRDPNRSYPLRK